MSRDLESGQPGLLPAAVRRVALLQLRLNAGCLVSMLVMLAIGAVAIVVVPFAMGREGVGIAMVSMTPWSLAAVLTVIPYLGRRGAQRMLRGDIRGPAPVRRVAWLVILLAVPMGAVGVFALQYWADAVVPTSGSDDAPRFLAAGEWFYLTLLGAALLVEAWTLVTLARHRQSLDNLSDDQPVSP